MSSHRYSGSLTRKDAAIRLIADHIRACCVAISDKAYPANEDAGFIVRKMLRRAFLQSSLTLGIEKGSLLDLVSIVVDSLVCYLRLVMLPFFRRMVIPIFLQLRIFKHTFTKKRKISGRS